MALTVCVSVAKLLCCEVSTLILVSQIKFFSWRILGDISKDLLSARFKGPWEQVF